MTFHGLSKNGTAKGQLVYVGRGTKEEFDELVELGINFKGKIVIAQYSGSFRGLKVSAAQDVGAVGVLLSRCLPYLYSSLKLLLFHRCHHLHRPRRRRQRHRRSWSQTLPSRPRSSPFSRPTRLRPIPLHLPRRSYYSRYSELPKRYSSRSRRPYAQYPFNPFDSHLVRRCYPVAQESQWQGYKAT